MLGEIHIRVIEHFKKFGVASLIREILVASPISYVGCPLLKLIGSLSGIVMFILLGLRNMIFDIDNNISSDKLKTVGVLGKGPSLENAQKLKFLDHFIIVNQFDSIIDDEHMNTLLKDKKIIHFINKQERVLSRRKILLYNIVRYQLSQSDPSKEQKRDRPERNRFRPESRGMIPHYIPESVEYYRNKENNFPGSAGLAAILYAAVGLDCDIVYASGFDFFRRGEYFKEKFDKSENYKRRKNLEKKIRTAEKSIVKIADFCPDTEFHIITNHPFEHNRKNLKFYTSENINGLEDIRATDE